MPKITHLLIINLDGNICLGIHTLCDQHGVRVFCLCKEDLMKRDVAWWVTQHYAMADAIVLAGHIPGHISTSGVEIGRKIRHVFPNMTVIIISDDDALAQQLNEHDGITFIHRNGNNLHLDEIAKVLHIV